jgi:hypothetical protein
VKALILRHKARVLVVAGAAAYVGLGLAMGDLDWTTAAAKFVTLIGLGAL